MLKQESFVMSLHLTTPTCIRTYVRIHMYVHMYLLCINTIHSAVWDLFHNVCLSTVYLCRLYTSIPVWIMQLTFTYIAYFVLLHAVRIRCVCCGLCCNVLTKSTITCSMCGPGCLQLSMCKESIDCREPKTAWTGSASCLRQWLTEWTFRSRTHTWLPLCWSSTSGNCQSHSWHLTCTVTSWPSLKWAITVHCKHVFMSHMHKHTCTTTYVHVHV